MIDSDNVLLLRPARPASGFSLENAERQTPGATENPRGLVVATIYHLKDGTETRPGGFLRTSDSIGNDQIWRVRYRVFRDRERIPTAFPALPVREAANVFVWFSVFPDEMTYERHAAALANSIPWKNNLAEELAARLKERPEILRLASDAAFAITRLTQCGRGLRAPMAARPGRRGPGQRSWLQAAITLSSIAIGVGNAPTSTVVRVGFGLPGPAKYSG